MADDASRYIQNQPGLRRERLASLRAAFLGAVPGVEESMAYRMPTFRLGGHWAAMASQKRHLAVYFCSEPLIAPIRSAHPELSYGKGCVRIRDNQELPVRELVAVFVNAMHMDKGS